MNKCSSLLATVLLFTTSGSLIAQSLISESLARARTADGSYIGWHEHIIDDPKITGFALSGNDGLVMGDIDVAIGDIYFSIFL